MYVVVVTGTRELRTEHMARITSRIRKCLPSGLNPASAEFMSGGSWGVDTFWAIEAQRLFPDARHTLIAPSAPWNEDGLDGASFTNIIRLQHGGYRRRNKVMVEKASQLDAFPLRPEQQQPRSGTWMTVRMAQKLELPLRIEVLDA